MLPGDTSAEAAEVQRTRIRELPPLERLRKGRELSNRGRRMALTAIHRRYPAAGGEEVRLRSIELGYGAALAGEVRRYLGKPTLRFGHERTGLGPPLQMGWASGCSRAADDRRDRRGLAVDPLPQLPAAVSNEEDPTAVGHRRAGCQPIPIQWCGPLPDPDALPATWKFDAVGRGLAVSGRLVLDSRDWHDAGSHTVLRNGRWRTAASHG